MVDKPNDLTYSGQFGIMMSGLIQAANTIGDNSKHLQRKAELFNSLVATVKECQTKYGGKTELATLSDVRRLVTHICIEQ